MGLFDLDTWKNALLGKPPSSEMMTIESPWGGFQEQLAGFMPEYFASGDWRQQPRRNLGLLGQGLNPDMQAFQDMTKAYASSPAPYIMGQAAGTLGNFMNPNLEFDPNNRLEGLFAGREVTDLFNESDYGGPDFNPGGPMMA